jgi:hypothetical protein
MPGNIEMLREKLIDSSFHAWHSILSLPSCLLSSPQRSNLLPVRYPEISDGHATSLPGHIEST